METLNEMGPRLLSFVRGLDPDVLEGLEHSLRGMREGQFFEITDLLAA